MTPFAYDYTSVTNCYLYDNAVLYGALDVPSIAQIPTSGAEKAFWFLTSLLISWLVANAISFFLALGIAKWGCRLARKDEEPDFQI